MRPADLDCAARRQRGALGALRGPERNRAGAAAVSSRRRALGRMGSLVLLLGARDIAWGAAIVAVRVWPADEYTRVTIESDAALSARHFLASAPDRLVID